MTWELNHIASFQIQLTSSNRKTLKRMVEFALTKFVTRYKTFEDAKDGDWIIFYFSDRKVQINTDGRPSPYKSQDTSCEEGIERLEGAFGKKMKPDKINAFAVMSIVSR